MKKILWLIVLVAILASAIPANAGGRNRRHHGQVIYTDYGLTGSGPRHYHGPTFLEHMRNQSDATVHGILRPSYWDLNTLTARDLNRRNWQWATQPHASLGIDHYGSFARGHRSPGEDISKCVERILKSAKKTKNSVTIEQAGAICTGQPIEPAQETVRVINKRPCKVFVGDLASGKGIYLAPNGEAEIAKPSVRPNAWQKIQGKLEQIPTTLDDDTLVVG